jgi:histidinol-phosphate aminotransferase
MKPNTAVLQMDPYKPPSSGRDGYLRLDFNENTVGCSPRVVRALQRAINRDLLAVYPEYETCRAQIAAGFGCTADETLLTNGTDDALLLLINTFIEPGDRVVLAEPCFAMYRFYLSLVGAKIVAVPRGRNFEFPALEVLAEIRRGARAVFIDNPNNPTGTVATPKYLESLARDFPDTLIVVDEAYYDFYGKTMLPLRRKYPNLVVTRTFSKAHGLAGIRLGCLFAAGETAAHLRKAHSPYNVNGLAIVAGLAALRDPEYTRRYAQQVLEARKYLETELHTLKIAYIPSAANFVLAKFGEHAAAMKDGLRDRGILVRDRSYEAPGWVRVTVGTMPQMRRLVRELSKELPRV